MAAAPLPFSLIKIEHKFALSLPSAIHRYKKETVVFSLNSSMRFTSLIIHTNMKTEKEGSPRVYDYFSKEKNLLEKVENPGSVLTIY